MTDSPNGERRAAIIEPGHGEQGPVPVSIAGPVPIPVVLASGSIPTAPRHVQDQATDPSKPAVTTFQEDLTTAGQRRVNLIWEYTQAVIALLVVFATMVCGVCGMVYDIPIPTIIAVAFGTVTGFYFSRTNHAAIGGVGTKPMAAYEGR